MLSYNIRKVRLTGAVLGRSLVYHTCAEGSKGKTSSIMNHLVCIPQGCVNRYFTGCDQHIPGGNQQSVRRTGCYFAGLTGSQKKKKNKTRNMRE